MKSVLTGNLETTSGILNQTFFDFFLLNFEQFVLGPKRCLAFIYVGCSTQDYYIVMVLFVQVSCSSFSVSLGEKLCRSADRLCGGGSSAL